MDFTGRSVFVTGGTGSFGKCFVKHVLRSPVSRVVIFSRDELKQSEMAASMKDDRLRFFIGDIRDYMRLKMALNGIDIVVHAAAMKQVPTAEYNPFEAVQTNVHGTENLVRACIDNNIEKAVLLSTDKACAPVNLYGATKLVAEKLFINGNSYVGHGRTRFAVVRYGNVAGSRGSVIPLWRECVKEKRPIVYTEPTMTRFFMKLIDAVELVYRALRDMQGGEIFVHKMHSCTMKALGDAIAGKDYPYLISGIRPGEKMHEELIPNCLSHLTYEYDDHYIIAPSYTWQEEWARRAGVLVASDFEYSSKTAPRIESIKEFLKDV